MEFSSGNYFRFSPDHQLAAGTIAISVSQFLPFVKQGELEFANKEKREAWHGNFILLNKKKKDINIF